MFQRMGRRLREARDLGSYELEERLGEGGMGEVWRAKHRLLARPAAIKLVQPEMLGADGSADSRLALQRFESEAQATAALTSPHTIRLFDFGATDDGRFYYVMELLDGRDMAALVGEFGPLPVPRVLFLLRQVCHSLAEAHSRGLVHRDIKPANIFVCRMGLDADVVKVLDFGLVQSAERDPAQDLTQTLATLQGVVGTPAFMAPEMIVGDRAVDHRADLYALGCVAYFLLTGEHVFQGGTHMQSLIDHVSTRAAAAVAPHGGRRFRPGSMRWCWPAWRRIPPSGRQDADDVLRRIDAHAGSLTWTNCAGAGSGGRPTRPAVTRFIPGRGLCYAPAHEHPTTRGEARRGGAGGRPASQTVAVRAEAPPYPVVGWHRVHRPAPRARRRSTRPSGVDAQPRPPHAHPERRRLREGRGLARRSLPARRLREPDGQTWDIVIDTANSVPWTREAVAALKGATGRFLYVSSTGVFWPYRTVDIRRRRSRPARPTRRRRIRLVSA